MLTTHSPAQLLVLRYISAEEAFNREELWALLDPSCIFINFAGISHGKEATLNAIDDGRRFSSNKRQFGKFTQVQHCLDTQLAHASGNHIAENDDFHYRAGFLGSGDNRQQTIERDGFDSSGFAQFEREGFVAVSTRAGLRSVAVRQTVVVSRNGKVVASITARLP